MRGRARSASARVRHRAEGQAIFRRVFLPPLHQCAPGERAEQRPECGECRQPRGPHEKGAFQVNGGHRHYSRLSTNPKNSTRLILRRRSNSCSFSAFDYPTSAQRLAVHNGAKPLHVRTVRWTRGLRTLTVSTGTFILWFRSCFGPHHASCGWEAMTRLYCMSCDRLQFEGVRFYLCGGEAVG